MNPTFSPPVHSSMVEVVLLRLRVSSGLPRLVAELFVRLLRLEQLIMSRGGRIGRWFREALNRSLEPILREEGMYTESLFLAREDGELDVLWYMEAEDVGHVYEAFEASDHGLTDVAARMGQWLFENSLYTSSSKSTDSRFVISHSYLDTEILSSCPRTVCMGGELSNHTVYNVNYIFV